MSLRRQLVYDALFVLVIVLVLAWVAVTRAQSEPSWICLRTLPTFGPYPVEAEVNGVVLPREPYRWTVTASGHFDQCVAAPRQPRPWFITGRIITSEGPVEAVLPDGAPGPFYYWGPDTCRADMNASGAVDLGDIPPLLSSLGRVGAGERADLSGNEVVDLPDVAAFLRLLGDAAGCGGGGT